MSAALSAFYTTVILIQHAFTSIIGIIGNVLVLVVYRNKLKDNESVTFFICHLALTDLACCLFLIPINCYHELNIGKIESDLMCKFHSFFNIINITYSCLLMTLVAFERFLSITYPLKSILTKTRTKFTLALLFTLCGALSLIGALSVGIYHKVYSFHKNATYISDLFELELNGHENQTNAIIHPSSINKDLLKFKRSTQESDSTEIENQHNIHLMNNNTIRHSFDLNNNNETIPYSWMATNNCFPNDQLISIHHFTYIRLFQNFIVVFCFVIIFILYAFICAFVSKRRYLKLNRDKYYRDIISRSKKNNMTIAQVEEPMLKNEIINNGLFLSNEFGYTFDSLKNFDLNQNNDNTEVSLTKNSPALSVRNNLICPPRIILNDNSHSENEFIGNDENEIENNNKSTQTVSSTIFKLKNLGQKPSIKPSISQNSIASKAKNGINQNENYNHHSLNYSSILLANMKTAFMLFVVTVIMAVVYTPALLTSLGYLPYNPLYWNIIYINNAINPLVYSFMNSNFRISLKKTFTKYFKRWYSF